MASDAFPPLLNDVLIADAARGGEATKRLSPPARVAAALAILHDDPLYAREYSRFVEGMAFAGRTEIPAFETARDAVDRLSKSLRDD